MKEIKCKKCGQVILYDAEWYELERFLPPTQCNDCLYKSFEVT